MLIISERQIILQLLYSIDNASISHNLSPEKGTFALLKKGQGSGPPGPPLVARLSGYNKIKNFRTIKLSDKILPKVYSS